MGLDITVHPIARRLDEHTCAERNDGCYDAGHVKTYAYVGFEQSMRGLEPLTPDSEHANVVCGGWYDVSAADSWGFRAGSYSSYGNFRRALARAAWGFEPDYEKSHPDQLRDLPFFELIYFADNEGTIGPASAADLAADFVEHGERVAPQLDEWDASSYLEWTRAFQAAAGHGLVVFG